MDSLLKAMIKPVISSINEMKVLRFNGKVIECEPPFWLFMLLVIVVALDVSSVHNGLHADVSLGLKPGPSENKGRPYNFFWNYFKQIWNIRFNRL